MWWVGIFFYWILCLFLLRDLSLGVEISLSVLSFFRRFGLNRGGGSGGPPSVTGGPSSFGIWRHVGCCSYSPVFYGLQVLVGRSPATGLSQESFLTPHPHSPFHRCPSQCTLFHFPLVPVDGYAPILYLGDNAAHSFFCWKLCQVTLAMRTNYSVWRGCPLQEVLCQVHRTFVLSRPPSSRCCLDVPCFTAWVHDSAIFDM